MWGILSQVPSPTVCVCVVAPGHLSPWLCPWDFQTWRAAGHEVELRGGTARERGVNTRPKG